MSWLVSRLGPTAGRVAFWAIVATLTFVILALGRCAYDRKWKTEVAVNRGQAGAAIESGRSAVNTVGNRQQAEQAGAANVQEDQRAIDNATDVGGATAAGLDGLHRVRGRKAPGDSR